MADFLDDGEFWLPPKFLADEETLLGLDLGSPVGSAETESDEDDLLADLSRKMTRSALENSGYGSSARFQTGSPQSTLRPTTRDLLYEAATEVAKMRLAEELYGKRAPTKAINSDNLRFAPTNVTYHQLLEYQIQQFKRQQLMKQQQQQQRSGGGGWVFKPKTDHYAAAKTAAAPLKKTFPVNGQQVGLSQASWPSLQQAAQPSSGMRPVFLRATTGKRECAGTGVFLPRRAEPQPPEPRKKPACSTTLLPTKLLETMDSQPQPQPHLHRFNGVDAAWNVRRNGHPNRSIPAQLKASSEIRLPQEWTY